MTRVRRDDWVPQGSVVWKAERGRLYVKPIVASS
jgi:hypothetical protein